MIKSDKRTTFLLKKRSFWTGFGSIFNISGNEDKFNISKTPSEADTRAIDSDWRMVGEDFYEALTK